MELYFVHSVKHGEVVGRTFQQAHRTADMIESGQIIFDEDGIGTRIIPPTIGDLIMSIANSLGDILIDRRNY